MLQKKLQNFLVTMNGTIVQISVTCLYTSWGINWWDSKYFFLVFLICGENNWHIIYLTLDLLGTVVSSRTFSWKYIYPLKKKWHYFWNGENDDLNMFSDNGTTLLMNSNFLTTSGGIKLMDYIIHLWKLIWSPSNCDLIVQLSIKLLFGTTINCVLLFWYACWQ